MMAAEIRYIKSNQFDIKRKFNYFLSSLLGVLLSPKIFFKSFPLQPSNTFPVISGLLCHWAGEIFFHLFYPHHYRFKWFDTLSEFMDTSSFLPQNILYLFSFLKFSNVILDPFYTYLIHILLNSTLFWISFRVFWRSHSASFPSLVQITSYSLYPTLLLPILGEPLTNTISRLYLFLGIMYSQNLSIGGTIFLFLSPVLLYIAALMLIIGFTLLIGLKIFSHF